MAPNKISPNPFTYDAAGNLNVESLLDLFVEDNNYSRFICAPRNLFIVGERGSGKSMMLRYNEFRTKIVKNIRDGLEPNNDFIGFIVECNTPLFARKQDMFENPDDFEAKIISEHLLVTELGQALATSLNICEDKILSNEKDDFFSIMDLYFPDFSDAVKACNGKVFESIKSYFKKSSIQVQREINSFTWLTSKTDYKSFASSMLPIFEELRKFEIFKKSHFMIMIDDAQNLNLSQKSILNTWISYRNQTVFSFKIGCAKSGYQDFQTLVQAPILEGHDYIVLDMEKSFQSPTSEYGIFANKVVAKRLQTLNSQSTKNANLTAKEFFPESNAVKKQIEVFTDKIKMEFLSENPNASNKQVNDRGYKYGRVSYFIERKNKSNRPIYSGFDTITHLSTGVIRGLLQPCYYMYEAMISKNNTEPVYKISPEVQSETILNESSKLWEDVKNLHRKVTDCTEEDAKHIHNLLFQLGMYFENRLLNHRSEPRVLAFTISGKNSIGKKEMLELNRLFNICKSSTLLYVRRGVSRDKSAREDFYTPNRLLWPDMGLDVIGQHGRASIKALDLYYAAKKSRKIASVSPNDNPSQGTLNL